MQSSYTGMDPVAYAGFWKGGGGQELQKIRKEQRSESEIVSSKFSPIFRPKLGEEQKKGLHSNLVRFFAQTWMQAGEFFVSFSNKVIPQLDKTLGWTGQTLRACPRNRPRRTSNFSIMISVVTQGEPL